MRFDNIRFDNIKLVPPSDLPSSIEILIVAGGGPGTYPGSGGGGAGIKPTVNGTASASYYGGGGGGYRSYITSTATPSYDGRGGGGFLIVVGSDT